MSHHQFIEFRSARICGKRPAILFAKFGAFSTSCLVICVVFCFGITCTAKTSKDSYDANWETVDENEAGRLAEDLIARWAKEGSSISSAILNIRQYRNAVKERVSRAEFFGLVDQLPSKPNDGQFTNFAKAVQPQLGSDQDRAFDFAKYSIWQRGDSAREDLVYDEGRNILIEHNGTHASLMATENSSRYQNITQVTIARSGAQSILPQRPDQFRFVMPSINPTDCKILGRSGNKLLVQTGKEGAFYSRAIVDEATGNILATRSYDESNELIRERVQKDFTTFAGGVVFPTFSCVSKYRKGNVIFICLTVIDAAQFNVPIADSVFQLPVAKSTILVDDRATPRRIQVLKNASENILADINQLRLGRPQRTGNSQAIQLNNGDIRRYLVLLNIGVIIAIIILLGYRAFMRQRHLNSGP